MDPALIIATIAVVAVVVIAWKEFGGKADLEQLRRRLRDNQRRG